MIMKAKPIDTTNMIMKATLDTQWHAVSCVQDTIGLVPQWIGKYALSNGHKTGLLI
jgi:hypothetical protein